MGPGAFKQRGALHLRFSEGFLVDTSVVSGSGSAWPLRSSPADMFELSKGATRLAAAYDLDRTLTLRWARSPVWSGGVMLLLKSWPTDLRPLRCVSSRSSHRGANAC